MTAVLEAEFIKYPKTPRFFRDIVITEKIDGTNAAVVIKTYDVLTDPLPSGSIIVPMEDADYLLHAQSRNRVITPGADNQGFARWVYENAEGLVTALGVGTHFGEWWGNGIQRGYGLAQGDKRFSLFNVARWTENFWYVPGLYVAPTLYDGPMDPDAIEEAIHELEEEGSLAAPGFMDPEGIVIFHTASRSVFKVTVKDDEQPKSA